MEDPLLQKCQEMMGDSRPSDSHLQWLARICARLMKRSLELDEREEALRKRESAQAERERGGR